MKEGFFHKLGLKIELDPKVLWDSKNVLWDQKVRSDPNFECLPKVVWDQRGEWAPKVRYVHKDPIEVIDLDI